MSRDLWSGAGRDLWSWVQVVLDSSGLGFKWSWVQVVGAWVHKVIDDMREDLAELARCDLTIAVVDQIKEPVELRL